MPYADYNKKREHNRTYYQRVKNGEPRVSRNSYWVRRRLESLIDQGIIEVEIQEKDL